MINKYKCCICFKYFEGYGNNPYPVLKEGECCNECNQKYVIPARISLMKIKEKENESK